MRVLLLAQSLGCGGAERQLLLLARGLQDRGILVQVRTLYSTTDTVANTVGLDVKPMKKTHRWDIGALWRLYRTMRKDAPDVIYSFLPVSNILAVFMAPWLGSRVIWSIRSSGPDLAADWLARACVWLERWLSRFVSLVIANSTAGRELAIANGWPREKIIVIPNGIDTFLFQPDFFARERAHAAWGIATHERVVGMVARFDPIKGHTDFLSAAAQLVKTHRNLRFVLVGDGPEYYRAALIALADQLGIGNCVIWVGRCLDMPAIYPGFDILCSASSCEGFPNVVGEAMACAVPCLVTAVGDSAQIVGDRTMTVPAHDVSQLTSGLSRLLERIECGDLNDSARRISLTRRRIVDQFSVERMVKETENAFRVVIKPLRANPDVA